VIDPGSESHGDYQIVEKGSTEPFTPTAREPMPPVPVTFIAATSTPPAATRRTSPVAEALYRKDDDRFGFPNLNSIANLAVD
jgi:hypothetical protein